MRKFLPHDFAEKRPKSWYISKSSLNYFLMSWYTKFISSELKISHVTPNSSSVAETFFFCDRIFFLHRNILFCDRTFFFDRNFFLWQKFISDIETYLCYRNLFLLKNLFLLQKLSSVTKTFVLHILVSLTENLFLLQMLGYVTDSSFCNRRFFCDRKFFLWQTLFSVKNQYFSTFYPWIQGKSFCENWEFSLSHTIAIITSWSPACC